MLFDIAIATLVVYAVCWALMAWIADRATPPQRYRHPPPSSLVRHAVPTVRPCDVHGCQGYAVNGACTQKGGHPDDHPHAKRGPYR